MTKRMTLNLQDRPGALVRVLGLTERRGYRLLSMKAEKGNDDQLQLELSVSAERPFHLLLRQLNKLFDVNSVEVAK